MEMVASPDDAQLVASAQAGRLDAFEELVRRYRQPIYRVALRVLGDAADAADATQDAFVQAWRSLADFRADAAFSTWMPLRVLLGKLRQPSRFLRKVRAQPAGGSRPDRW